MIEQPDHGLTVRFDACDAGWINMQLSTGERVLTVHLSHFLDPLPYLLAWLEAIVVGVEECGFRIDEEGRYVHFLAGKRPCASPQARAYTILSITPQYDIQPLQATLQPYDLVWIFYRSFRVFADSAAYVREQWEYSTLEQMALEQTGLSVDGWIDSVISLEPRRLQMALWRLDPNIIASPPDYLDNIGTEAELMELTGKTRAEARGLPCYWLLPQELWGEYASVDIPARRNYLQECLLEPLESSWSGTPWRRMRSPLIENWLDSERADSGSFWKKWLT